MKISHLWLICDFSKSWNIKLWKVKCFYRNMWSPLSGLLMSMPYLSMSGNWSAWGMYLNKSFDPFQYGIQRNFNKMLGIRYTLFYNYFYKKLKAKYLRLPSHGYYYCIGLKHLPPWVQPYKSPTWKILEVFHYPKIPISISDSMMRCSTIYFLTFLKISLLMISWVGTSQM